MTVVPDPPNTHTPDPVLPRPMWLTVEEDPSYLLGKARAFLHLIRAEVDRAFDGVVTDDERYEALVAIRELLKAERLESGR